MYYVEPMEENRAGKHIFIPVEVFVLSEGRAPSSELGTITCQNDPKEVYNQRTRSFLRVTDPSPVEGTRPSEGTNTSIVFWCSEHQFHNGCSQFTGTAQVSNMIRCVTFIFDVGLYLPHYILSNLASIPGINAIITLARATSKTHAATPYVLRNEAGGVLRTSTRRR